MGGKISGGGTPTNLNITQSQGSGKIKSVASESVKTGKGQKVSRLKKKLKSLLPKKSTNSEGKKKAENKPLAKRGVKHSESAGSVKGNKNKTHADHGTSIATYEGFVEGSAGDFGLMGYAAMKYGEDISAFRDSGLSTENSLESASMESSLDSASMENTALDEGERLLQILKDSAEAGIVRDDIEALVDASQTSLDQAIDLKESIGVQKDSVTAVLGDKEGVLATAEESQGQLSQRVADGTSQVNQLQTDVDDLQGSIAETNQAIAEQQDLITGLQNQLAEGQRLLEIANEGVRDTVSDAANPAFNELTALVEENQAKLAGQQAELTSLKSALEVKNTELASAESQLAELQEPLAEVENTVITLTEETTALQGQLDDLEQDYAQASEQVSEAEDQLTELSGIDDLANDAAEAGDLEAVQELLAEAEVVAGEAGVEAFDASEVVVSETASSADISDLFDPLSVGVDVGAGIFGHSLTLGLKAYKLSKLKNRQEAFNKCNEVIDRWASPGVNAGQDPASVQDLKDYALIAKLTDTGPGPVEKTNHLRAVLSESKCHLSNDGKIAKLVDNLIQIAGGREGSKDSVIGKESRGKPIADQLEQWKKDFESKGQDYKEGKGEGKTRSEDGKKRLKLGHQSKRLMQQFNAIVKPLGVEMKYNTPVLRKIGESALATDHRFVINDKKLHDHLTKTAQLPTKNDVKGQVLEYKNDAPALKSFANYEQRKIDHQVRQMKWTGAALATAMIPVLKVDNGVRALRELEDGNYRSESNQLLDNKLGKLALFSTNRYEMVKANPSLQNALELAADVINAKKDRTSVKQVSSDAQAAIDVAAASAGTVASIAAPGIGSLATNATVGVAKLSAAGASIVARGRADRKNKQFGRIETKVYSSLKETFNNSESKGERGDILSLTEGLFDISSEQAKMLFNQSSEKDLVSAKGMIRLRFTNTLVGKPAGNSGKAGKTVQSGPMAESIYSEISDSSVPGKAVSHDNHTYESQIWHDNTSWVWGGGSEDGEGGGQKTR